MAGAVAGALFALRQERAAWLARLRRRGLCGRRRTAVVGRVAARPAVVAADCVRRARPSRGRPKRSRPAAACRKTRQRSRLSKAQLRSDASPGAAGVSLNVDVDRIRGARRRPCRQRRRPHHGGRLARAAADGAVARRPAGAAAGRSAPGLAVSRRGRPGRRAGARRCAARRSLGTTKSGALVEVVARAGWIDERMADARALARRAIGDAVGRWSARSAAIVTAIVIGDRAGLDDDVERRLQEAGTYHVIAISGGNIAILAGLMIAGFRLAGLLGRTAMLASIVLLVAYGRLVGGGASVDRATLMAVVYLAARAADQRSPPLNALACVAVVPARGGSAVGRRPGVRADVRRDTGHPRRRAAAGVAPSSARLASGAAVGAARRLRRHRSAAAAGRRDALLARDLRRPRAELPGDSADGRHAGRRHGRRARGVRRALAVARLRLRRARGRRRTRLVGRSRSVCARGDVPGRRARVAVRRDLLRGARWLSGSARARAVPLDRRGRRCHLDAGRAVDAGGRRGRWPAPRDVSRRGAGRLGVPQVSAAAPRCSSTPAASSRAASGFDIGDRVVAPPLRIAGVRRLDSLVLTHGDPDHIGGAGSILREFRPREVWEGIPVPRFEPLATLRATAGELGLRWTNVRTGDRVEHRRGGRRRRAPGPCRLGAAARAQRRLHRGGRALAGRLDSC